MIFDIPDNSDILAQLIEAVPVSWSYMHGKLWVPKALVTSGEANEHAGLAVKDRLFVYPTIEGCHDNDLLAILVDRKLPAFIDFDEPGQESHYVTFDLVKKLVAHYLRIGYRGHLSFFRDRCKDGRYGNAAEMRIVWHCPPLYHGRDESRRLQLEYMDQGRGVFSDIQPLLDLCGKLKLGEHVETI